MRKNVVFRPVVWHRQTKTTRARFKTRFEVITFCEVNPQVGKRKAAGKVRCDKIQIQSILLKKEEIIKDLEANVSSKKKRCRGGNNVEIEKTLLDWFRKARSKNIPVTGPMPQEKARRVADALGLSQEDFKALIDIRIEMASRPNAFLERRVIWTRIESTHGGNDIQIFYKDGCQRTSEIWTRLLNFSESFPVT